MVDLQLFDLADMDTLGLESNTELSPQKYPFSGKEQ